MASGDTAADVAGEITRAVGQAVDHVTSGTVSCDSAWTGEEGFGDPELHVIDLDGHLRCTSHVPERAEQQDYVGTDWLVELRAAPVGEAIIVAGVADPMTKRPVVVLVAARLPDGGRAMVATVDVARLARDLDARYEGRPLAPYFTIVDSDRGYMFARSAPGGGGPTTDSGFSVALASGRDPVFMDFDGYERIWGEASIDALGWHLFSGVMADDALAAARGRMHLSMTFAFGVLVAGAVVALVSRRRRSPVASGRLEEPREHVGVRLGRVDELRYLDEFACGVRPKRIARTEHDRRDPSLVDQESRVRSA